jgi:hypothetical protein
MLVIIIPVSSDREVDSELPPFPEKWTGKMKNTLLVMVYFRCKNGTLDLLTIILTENTVNGQNCNSDCAFLQ